MYEFSHIDHYPLGLVHQNPHVLLHVLVEPPHLAPRLVAVHDAVLLQRLVLLSDDLVLPCQLCFLFGNDSILLLQGAGPRVTVLLHMPQLKEHVLVVPRNERYQVVQLFVRHVGAIVIDLRGGLQHALELQHLVLRQNRQHRQTARHPLTLVLHIETLQVFAAVHWSRFSS